MQVFRPTLTTPEQLTMFHSEDYVSFLQHLGEHTTTDSERSSFLPHEDCPIFSGLFDFCLLYSSGSIGGAARLNENRSDVCINWSGGLHHAKKSQASGFCYVNDCVLAILELLKHHQRVLYVDIDAHHGDGVEEAFYATNRVMTCSFHKYGQDFFPGTGSVVDTGSGPGLGYSINFPLADGMDDESFRFVFEPMLTRIVERFRPEAIVLQCGADSLSGDMLGCFNLSLQGHANCVSFVQGLNLPLLILGGGGYTMNNVARCWAYETGVILKRDMADDIPPDTNFYNFFGPSHRLRIAVDRTLENKNTQLELLLTMQECFNVLDKLEPVPGLAPTTLSSSSLSSKEEICAIVCVEETTPDQRTEDIACESKRVHSLDVF